MKLLILSAILCLASSNIAATPQHISPTDHRIHIGGSANLVNMGDSIVLNRHSAEMWENADHLINEQKANTTSGIYLRFTTNSRTCQLLLSPQASAEYRGVMFSVYKNGKHFKNQRTMTLTQFNDATTEWKVYLPIMTGMVFKGIAIEEGATLFENKTAEKVINYVSIGNSITHGVGQTTLGGDATYPALLAQAKGWELYNLAVGGSKICPAIADDFNHLHADVITVLWGYNDWVFTTATFDEIIARYTLLLSKLRANHPESTIYCILPTFTTNTEARERTNTSETIQRLRTMQRTTVENLIAKGDKKIHLINGEELTTAADLNDKVHLNIEGAARFAKQLEQHIHLAH